MDWTQIGIVAGAIATIAALVGGFFKKVLPGIRKWSRFIDRVMGVPADARTGQQAILGLFERMDHQDSVLVEQDKKLEEQSGVLETIRHEVEFNNGSSVKDAIRRIENHWNDALAKPDPPTTTINVNGVST